MFISPSLTFRLFFIISMWIPFRKVCLSKEGRAPFIRTIQQFNQTLGRLRKQKESHYFTQCG